MKKIYLAVFLACSIGGAVQAQISEGGLPWSMKNELVASQNVSKVIFPEPDYAQYLAEDEADAKAGLAKPYRVAAIVPSDINLQNSGTWTYLEDGSKIWRMEISVPNAKALRFNYDKFNLPVGVRFYLKNESGTQVLGAFTNKNTSPSEVFAHEEIQGSVTTLEIDIDATVEVSTVKFHVNEIYPYYRGAEAINLLYGSTAKDAQKPTDAQSTCHINANCPAGDGVNFAKAKSATVQINMGNAVCSGTMINSAGNSTGGTCKPLMLTASHCDDNNSRENANFENWTFAFNYQYIDCAGGPLQNYQTRTGANFRARSNLPSIPNSGNAYVADFLLLELLAPPPAAANAYLVGWNRSLSLQDEPDYYTKFVGFHHPGGDRKKLSVSESIDGSGRFNQTVVNNTHWKAFFTVGGTEGGSSGSGLFDVDGLLVGDLSGGPASTGGCAPMGYNSLYSKLGYAWENAFDQTNFPQYAGAQSRLKDWLDPTNTGRIKLPSTKSDCSDFNQVGVSELEEKLNNSVAFYPNPSTTGIVNAQLNFADQTDLVITVYNVLGMKLNTFEIRKALKGSYKLDLNNLANGLYLLNVSSQNVSVSKRIVINK